VEFSNDPDFSAIIQVEASGPNEIILPDSTHPYSLTFPPVSARFARITCPTPANKGESINLQLDEITVNGGFPIKERIKLVGFPTSTDSHPLNDQLINGHILQEPVLKATTIVRRHALLKEQQAVTQKISDLKTANRRTLFWMIGTSLTALLCWMGSSVIRQKRKTRRDTLRVRKQIQQDLHDEIGSQLSTISLVTEHLTKQKPRETIRCKLLDVNQCAREAIASLNEVIWLTDKEILTLDQCLLLMQKRATQMIDPSRLEIDFPKHSPATPLPGTFKRNLFLLFTEAINNSLKYSDAETITVRARLSDNELILLIADNGCGFDPKTITNGMGLKGIRDRALALKGTLTVTSSPGNGTEILFKTKIKTS
jgi:signal transduction histidine kinase